MMKDIIRLGKKTYTIVRIMFYLTAILVVQIVIVNLEIQLITEDKMAVVDVDYDNIPIN
jgi:hypothetical protein